MEIIIWNSVINSLIRISPLIIILWLLSCLAETNRTPFDFSEGESELVSGFNIEYGAGGFALIFIAEYCRILYLRAIRMYLRLGFMSFSFYSRIFTILLVFFWVWARATLPRFRYDLLINLAWKRILPVVLVYLELSLIFLI